MAPGMTRRGRAGQGGDAPSGRDKCQQQRRCEQQHHGAGGMQRSTDTSPSRRVGPAPNGMNTVVPRATGQAPSAQASRPWPSSTTSTATCGAKLAGPAAVSTRSTRKNSSASRGSSRVIPAGPAANDGPDGPDGPGREPSSPPTRRLVPAAVVEGLQGDVEPEAQVTAGRAVDVVPGPLQQDREVRRLLDLDQGDPRPDGVRDAGRDQAVSPGLTGILLARRAGPPRPVPPSTPGPRPGWCPRGTRHTRSRSSRRPGQW